MPSRSGTSIVLFTRDLRVHDHPALVAAAGSRRMIAVFVLDDTILSRPYAAPNRLRILIDSLTDLRRALRDLGSELVITRGRPAEVVRDLVRRHGVDAIHCSADVSAFARRREAALGAVAAELDAMFTAHPGVMLVDKAEDGGYVTPVECVGDYATFISRVRRDPTVESGLALWCVSDNLRKGAALNAVQIAELLGRRHLKKAA